MSKRNGKPAGGWANARRVAAFAVSGGIIAVVFALLDWEHFLELLQRIDLGLMIAIVLLYFVLGLVRALRFRALLEDSTLPLFRLFSVTLLHNGLAQILPFRSGEAAYPILLRREFQKPIADSFSSLVGARLLELIFVIGGGLIGILSAMNNDGALPLAGGVKLVFSVFVLLGVAIGLAMAAPKVTRITARVAHWLLDQPKASFVLRKLPRLGVLDEKLEATALRFERLRNPRVLLAAGFFSFAAYCISIVSMVLLLRGLGLSIDLGASVAVISLVMVASWLPLTVSGFGAVEGSWTIGLVALAGLSLGEAAAIGFLVHIVQLFVTTFSGSVGLLLLLAFRNAKHGAIDLSSRSSGRLPPS